MLPEYYLRYNLGKLCLGDSFIVSVSGIVCPLKHNVRRYVLFACPTIGGLAWFLPSRRN